MHFTRYYSGLIKAHGLPQLDVEQHCRLMNIISLEGRLSELEQLKKDLKDSNGYHKFDIRIHKVQFQIKKLTENKFPKDVMQNLVYKSDII